MLCNIKPVPFHESDKHIFAKIPGGGGGPDPRSPPSGSAHAVGDPADIGLFYNQAWIKLHVGNKGGWSNSTLYSLSRWLYPANVLNQTMQVYLCQILKFYQLQATSTWAFFPCNDGSWDIHMKKNQLKKL